MSFGISSPEYNLFKSMCWLYDEAVRTYRELQELEQLPINVKVEDYQRVSSQHRTMCTQTVITSFLVLEAYLNSVAYLTISQLPCPLSEKQQAYLQEQVADKQGNLRQKFVSIEDKLCEWVKLISSRGETFDKGTRLFQEFVQLKKYRDSIVHLSANKVTTYNSIDFDVCKRSVDITIQFVEKINEFISPSQENVEPVWWIKHLTEDGLFKLPEKLI